jgi:hypothetical protein
VLCRPQSHSGSATPCITTMWKPSEALWYNAVFSCNFESGIQGCVHKTMRARQQSSNPFVLGDKRHHQEDYQAIKVMQKYQQACAIREGYTVNTLTYELSRVSRLAKLSRAASVKVLLSPDPSAHHCYYLESIHCICRQHHEPKQCNFKWRLLLVRR